MTAGGAAGPTHHLEWRIRLFGVGAIFGLVGIWYDQHWLVNIAIAVLAAGVVLRFARRRHASPEFDDQDDD